MQWSRISEVTSTNLPPVNERGKVKIGRMILAVAMMMLCSARMHAQELRGTVRDSATGRPIAGAVVSLFDAAGASIGRNLSNETGQFRVVAPQVAQRLRVVRLGFRPREIRLADGAQDVVLLLTPIPPTLEAVHVTAASNCPERKDAAAAYGLLEQARSGLLATIVAREANPATLKMLEFQKSMDGNSDNIEHMTVTIDSSEKATTSFVAERTGAEFVQRGFTRENVNGTVYSGPDAEALLDDAFAAGYCFRISEPEKERPREVGLSFKAATEKKGRVDIEGTLWIDTTARSLHDIVYRYVGITAFQGNIEPGGHIWFREMPNGAVLVDRWTLRLSSVRMDHRRVIRFASEGGGEVARAVWKDGKRWEASLGSAKLHIVDSAGRPLAGKIVNLDSTEYIGVSNAEGIVVIRDLEPGPYSVSFLDTALAHAPVRVPSLFKFDANRGRVDEAVLHFPRDDDFLKVACQSGKDTHWYRVTIVNDFDGSPEPGSRWEVGADLGGEHERVMGTGTVRADGSRGLCLRPPDHVSLQMRGSSASDPARKRVEKLGNEEAVVVRLPVKP